VVQYINKVGKKFYARKKFPFVLNLPLFIVWSVVSQTRRSRLLLKNSPAYQLEFLIMFVISTAALTLSVYLF